MMCSRKTDSDISEFLHPLLNASRLQRTAVTWPASACSDVLGFAFSSTSMSDGLLAGRNGLWQCLDLISQRSNDQLRLWMAPKQDPKPKFQEGRYRQRHGWCLLAWGRRVCYCVVLRKETGQGVDRGIKMCSEQPSISRECLISVTYCEYKCSWRHGPQH